IPIAPRNLPSRRYLDLPLVYPHIVQAPVDSYRLLDAFLGLARNLLYVPEDAVLVQGQAALLRHRPQVDVVILRTRVVLQGGAPAPRFHDPEIDLDQALIGREQDDGLRLAGRQDLPDPRHGREGFRDRPGVLRGRQDVDVVDDLLHATEAPARRELPDRRRFPEMREDDLRDRVGRREEEKRLSLLHELDAPQDLLLRLLAKSLQLAEAMGLRGLAQRLDVRDPQLLPQLLDLLRADPADPQHVEHAGRETGLQLLVVSDLAGRHVLGDLLPERLP